MTASRTLTITYEPTTGFYHLDGRRVDGDTATIAYCVRELSNVPHGKKPAWETVRQACRDAKSSGKPITVLVAQRSAV